MPAVNRSNANIDIAALVNKSIAAQQGKTPTGNASGSVTVSSTGGTNNINGTDYQNGTLTTNNGVSTFEPSGGGPTGSSSDNHQTAVINGSGFSLNQSNNSSQAGGSRTNRGSRTVEAQVDRAVARFLKDNNNPDAAAISKFVADLSKDVFVRSR